MIATAHAFNANVDDSYSFDSNVWSSLATIEVSRPEAVTEVKQYRHRDDLIAACLARMCMSSLNAYRTIVFQADSLEVREFAEVVAQQRSAQYRALLNRVPFGQLSRLHASRSANTFPDALERSEWQMAFWGLEDQISLVDAGEHIERAECLLEEAYLIGRSLAASSEFADELSDFAVSVCGTRQRWEEICENRIASAE